MSPTRMQEGSNKKGSNAYVPTKADTQQSFHRYCIEEWLRESIADPLQINDPCENSPPPAITSVTAGNHRPLAETTPLPQC